MIRKLFGGFDKMLCCSETCERRDRCAKHIKNVIAKTNAEECVVETVEDLSSHGEVTISNYNYMEKYTCGVLGDYRLYEPIPQNEIIVKLDDILNIITEFAVDYANAINNDPSLSTIEENRSIREITNILSELKAHIIREFDPNRNAIHIDISNSSEQ